MATAKEPGAGGDEATGAAAEDHVLVDAIVARCAAAAQQDDNALFDFLVGERKIEKKAVERAVDRGSLSLSTWHHAEIAPGAIGYGGPAAAFIVRDQTHRRAVAVDMHYIEPATNGGQKICVKGERTGYPWCSDWQKFENARTVYVVASGIDALSIESCVLPGSAVVATRGLANVARIDWSFMRGKSVVACFSNDPPAEKGPDFGYSAGARAGWRLHEILTALDTSCMHVDQAAWYEDQERKKPIRDVNAFLQLRGHLDLAVALRALEEWVVPGLPAEGKREGKSRLYLPSHDWFAYRRYRVQPDFTRTLDKQVKDEDTGTMRWTYNDTCGFRIAAISRVQIASATSTMTGDKDLSPTTVFSISVQTARHGARLLRRVVDDEKLHNLDGWKKVGPVFAPAAFSRLVNVWERAADIGAREAVNFVGIAWRDGRPIVNEGPDCFFQDPRQQCPYHSLTFPSGTPEQGRAVIREYQKTFKQNAAAIPLVWALGGHLKAFLGFWPHFVMQAEKGSGKSTLIKRMERSLAFTMFSRQSMGSEFRMLTSISYTSHPVGWEEISAGKQELIDKAVAQLQESYQHSHTRRGSEMTEFLLCAPVLLAGEDVPVEGLTGKLVRCQLTRTKRGPLMDQKLPVFPVRQWLQYLASLSKDTVLEMHAQLLQHFQANCVAASDTGAERMVTNYAALGLAWRLLCDFTGCPEGSYDLMDSLVEEMNTHITESTSERQPWALIVDKMLSEIASNQFRFPFKFDTEDGAEVLCVRTNHVMAHLSSSNNLRPFWDRMTIKSDRALKEQLKSAGVLLMERGAPNKPMHVERTVQGQRVSHMVALNLKQLAHYGLHATIPVEKPIGGTGGTSTSKVLSAAATAD
ncbi:toprim domain-containing protein [Ramlibacter sp.]|uniref:toprim domain-containing protein n=1 Tax=Ramlibacter sp. TaxID=1917967 RepID=UPI003D09A9B8